MPQKPGLTRAPSSANNRKFCAQNPSAGGRRMEVSQGFLQRIWTLGRVS